MTLDWSWCWWRNHSKHVVPTWWCATSQNNHCSWIPGHTIHRKLDGMEWTNSLAITKSRYDASQSFKLGKIENSCIQGWNWNTWRIKQNIEQAFAVAKVDKNSLHRTSGCSSSVRLPLFRKLQQKRLCAKFALLRDLRRNTILPSSNIFFTLEE